MSHGLCHYNPALSHQVDHARAFEACGFDSVATSCGQPADVHVISGPHFAYNMWKHHDRVLMIDRAWWGDGDDDPKVSIGWLQRDGSRKFASGDAPRPKPVMAEWKQPWPTFGEIQCLVLADYGQDVSEIVEQASKRFNTVSVREHPDDQKHIATLQEAIGWHDVVIGSKGSAIFESIRLGVPVICTEPTNACMPVCAGMDGELFRGDRSDWLHSMSYKQFSIAEIADGTVWELLKDVQ